MSSQRPRLIFVHGSTSLSPDQYQYLKSAFDVIEVENIDAARANAQKHPGAIIASEYLSDNGLFDDETSGLTSRVVEHVGEGAGLVDETGELLWANRRLKSYSPGMSKVIIEHCLEAIERFNRPEEADTPIEQRLGRRSSFGHDDNHFELLATPAPPDEANPGRINSVAFVIWNVTVTRTLQAKIDAIDAAGSELMCIKPTTMSSLNMAERLTLIEEKIVRYVNEILDFDNFEVRLLNRETSQLELVISCGIAPLKVGEVMHASETGNGISGYVAATGKSYVCTNVRRDPMYRDGLDNAASSLTVPLKLYDQVIGVFNIESYTLNVFDDNDRQFAEIFGRYIAAAMNILDLLVVERYTTNEELTQNMLGELSKPLGEIATQAEALRDAKSAKQRREHLDHIVDAAIGMRSRIESCTSGPRSILNAEEELHRLKPDPQMTDKFVLIADDEENIRVTLSKLLSQKGCQVTICASGLETIELLKKMDSDDRRFDLVISDIKMPGCNGYEVFHTVKEICPDTPVILMTGFGYDPNHSIVRASQEGLHSFLFKPFKAAQLLELVEKAFEPAAAE